MTHVANTPNDALNYLRETPSLPIVSVLAVKFAVCVSKWATRRRTRMTLRTLTNDQLRDVGLTPTQAHQEAARVFWRA